jgi:malonate-semialdehyde dehydrogenase (acetylating)/methylmalonate-semialdehyde dehydrogenase
LETKVDTQVIKNFINGQWVESDSSQTVDVPDPATGEILCKVPLSTKADVDNAVKAADEAFKTWSKTPVPVRARVMFKFHSLMVEKQEELAQLVTKENGKSIKEARGEVLRAIECVEFATGAPTHMMGENLSTIATDIQSEMYRYPLGVVAGISPFNFPAMCPAWMYPLAIALGNTFVLKPSERTPLLANEIATLLKQAGLPDGVFNIVHGAHDVVNGFIEHPVIKAISFVGSQPVAKYVYENAAKQGKRVQAHSGAKNHHIVMSDADIDTAVDNIIASAYGSAGERCMACSAVVVIDEIADQFIEKLVEKTNQVKIGSGFDESVGLTPLIRDEHRQKVLKYVEIGQEEGATLVRDGRKEMDQFENGYFLGPTIFDQVTTDMTIAKEEIFAPVLSILRAKDLSEAIGISNTSRFGNSATLYTENATAVRQFREDATAGMLGVNVGVPAPMAFFPFSGMKDSFYGDLHVNGKSGVEFYTAKKMITSRFKQ